MINLFKNAYEVITVFTYSVVIAVFVSFGFVKFISSVFHLNIVGIFYGVILMLIAVAIDKEYEKNMGEN